MDFHTPVESPAPQEGNPAKRDDPRQAVPEQERPNLPRNDKKKLAKSCFVYDEEFAGSKSDTDLRLQGV